MLQQNTNLFSLPYELGSINRKSSFHQVDEVTVENIWTVLKRFFYKKLTTFKRISCKYFFLVTQVIYMIL